jgi:hypothetical protein
MSMKTNWEHQKEAITTDQRNRHRDEHSDELEKHKLDDDAGNKELERRELRKKGSASDSDGD